MSDVSDYRSGRPCWFELLATDLNSAEEFYGPLLGWEFDSTEPDRHRALLRGKTVAAINAARPDEEQGWLVHLATDDAAAATSRIVAEGGQVITEPSAAPSGVAAVAEDPTGGVFGLWQGGSSPGSEVADEPGAPCWAEASSTDTKAAAAFYGTVFGMDTKRPFRGYNYTQLRVGGQEVAGILGHTHERRPKRGLAAWLVYFQVADVDAAVRAALATGGTLLEKTQDTPFGRFAIIADPVGGRAALITRSAR